MFRNFLIAAFKAFCFFVTFVSLASIVFAIGPTLETRYLPVVSKLRIISMSPYPTGHTYIQAEFTKLRDCEYIGLSWFVRGPYDIERVPVILLRPTGDTSSPNRPMGAQRAGPWDIALPPSELKTRSFATLYHRCHPFWMTKTDFYP